MKANELRHGNWIDTKEFHVEKLRGIYQYDSSWYEYVSMFKYGFQAAVLNEFDSVNFSCSGCDPLK